MRSAVVQRTMPDDEHELIERARAGDEDAFRTLVDTHRAHVYGLALRITHSPADAEEVAQQAFVQAWFALGQFRGDSRFSTWIHRIAARRALDRSTRMKSRQAREESGAEIVSGGAAVEPRDTILIRRLETLMQRLSAAQRAVVTLHYWDDLPVSEIATALGMPVNTVKTHLSRARRCLREHWIEEETRR